MTNEPLPDIDICNPKFKMIDKYMQEKLKKTMSVDFTGDDDVCCANLKKLWKVIQHSGGYTLGLIERNQYEEHFTTKVHKSYEVYVHYTQIRLIYVWILAILTGIFGNPQLIPGITQIAIVVVFSLITAFCSIIFLLWICRRKMSICEFINNAFGIPHPSKEYGEKDVDKLFDFDRRVWGFWFWLFVFFCSINNLFLHTVFYLSPSDLDRCKTIGQLRRSTDIFVGKCAVNKSTVAQFYVFITAICVIFPSYYKINRLYVTDMNKYLNGNNDNLLTPKITKLKEYIQNKLVTEWSKTKSKANRKLEIFLTLGISFAFHFVIYGIYRNHVFDIEVEWYYIFMCIYLYIVESMMLFVLIYNVIQTLKHYQFPSYILNLLSYQFNANNIEDIICWWQLRKYYLECIIDIYGQGITGWIGAGIMSTLGLAVFVFTERKWNEVTPNDDTSILIWIGYGVILVVMLLTLSLASAAVDVYRNQLSHIHTLNKEKLRLECIGYDKSEKSKYSAPNGQKIWEQLNGLNELNELIMNAKTNDLISEINGSFANIYKTFNTKLNKQYEVIFDKIIIDIENVQAIKVFGIKMRPEVLLFWRAFSVALAIASMPVVRKYLETI